MEQIDVEKFGRFVFALRKAQGLTQKELGEQLFVTDKTVSKWERGLSLPNISLLLPLAEALDVTVTELLRGARAQAEVLPLTEVEHLLTQSLGLTPNKQKDWRKWIAPYIICLCAGAAEMFGLVLLGCNLEIMSHSIVVTEILLLIFAGCFCFGVPVSLPAFYDSNDIPYVTSGVFRIHVTGMRFNNRNWPRIVRASRRYTLYMTVVYPLLYALAEVSGLNQAMFFPSLLSLAVALGLFFPIVWVGKKYESL